MKARITLLVVGVLVAISCSGTSSSTTGAAPSVTPPPAPTSTVPRIVDGGLMPVDPETLFPTADSDPLLVADFFWGVTSSNGAYTAVAAADDESEHVAIIDAGALEVISEAPVIEGVISDLTVSDDGVAYWLSGGTSLSLKRLDGDNEAPVVVYDQFPVGFSSVELELLPDGRFGVFGASHDQRPEGLATIVLVSADGAGHEQIELENVVAGLPNDLDPDASVQVFRFSGNSPVWDHENSRMLLVEGARDVITEVDLDSGEAVEHAFRPIDSFLDRIVGVLTPKALAKGPTAGIAREAVLSPDGLRLFVATSVTETIVEEESWETVRSPRDLMVVNLESWETSSLEVVADRLWPSPDAELLLAQGARVTEGTAAGLQTQPSPLYVIDMSVPEVLAAFPLSEDSESEVQFLWDGSLAYIETLAAGQEKVSILDLSLLQVTGDLESPRMSLVGGPALLAFHSN